MSGNSKKSVQERLNKNISGLNAYSVPHVECSIRLDGNESPFNIAGDLPEKFMKGVSALEINRYPDSAYKALKSRISGHTGIPEEGIVLGNGSDELIQMLIQCYTGKSGTILVPTPTFSMYGITGVALGKEVVEVELDESFDIDTKAVSRMISDKDPDLFFFATPNNPTANKFSRDRITEVIESTTGLVVIDEAYYDYSGTSLLSLVNEYENVVILRTLSKIGFAALRLGILLAGETVAKQVNKARLPYNINSLTMHIAAAVYDNYELIQKNVDIVRSERERLCEELENIKEVGVYPSDANFLLIKVDDSENLFNELVKRDILVRKLAGVDRLDNCLRITVGTPDENTALINALSDIFSAQVGIVDQKNGQDNTENGK